MPKLGGCVKRFYLCLITISIASIAACGTGEQVPEGESFGANPTLPAPDTSLIPTVRIAPAKGWSDGETPKDQSTQHPKQYRAISAYFTIKKARHFSAPGFFTSFVKTEFTLLSLSSAMRAAVARCNRLVVPCP